ncbi:MAG TPA: hypothetical protein DCE56_13355 [Cyanobacteria bacterium UBA8553]|nr:hypothetical protein [Cyanobacteria bacterium UBA8553]
MIALSTPIVFLAGCTSAAQYVDDAAKTASNGVRNLSDKTDDATRVVLNGKDEFLKLAKKQVKSCAKKQVKAVVKRVIETAISSNKNQISQEEVLNVAKNAFQECPEVKALDKSKKSIDNLLTKESSSVVSEVKLEYEKRIKFNK